MKGTSQIIATVDLVTKLAPYVDEMSLIKGKLSMLTNKDFDWTGAHTVRVYKVNTSGIDDYDRPGTGLNANRSGPVARLGTVTEEAPLRKDRPFTLAIGKLNTDEVTRQLQATTASAHQQREVVISEVGSYIYDIMSADVGTKPVAVALAAGNIYAEILKVSQALDDTEAPETGRVLIVAPAVYVLMRKYKDIVMKTGIDNDLHLRGVPTMLNGANVVKVPAVWLLEAFGFLLAHPVAIVAPAKLEDYRIHQDPPGISGTLVEGHTCYDASILDNKKEALYYQAVTV